MSTLAKCRSCRASIEWAIFDRSRKAVALDVGLVDDGNLSVVGHEGETPVVRTLTKAEREFVRDAGGALRRAHFASCPDAERWRRAR